MTRPSTTYWANRSSGGTDLNSTNLNARRGEDLDYTEAQRVHAGTLKVFGHSFADVAGTGTSIRRNRWAGRVAAMLGANEENYARGASFLACGPDEITSRVMQLVVPPTTSARNYSEEYQAPSQIAVLFGGVNDAAVAAVAANSWKAITEGYRTSICRLRQAANFEDSHSSVVYAQNGGTTNWTVAQATGGRMSGQQAALSGSVNNRFTITVPSHFPGGELYVYFMVAANGGGTWGITLDGVAQANFVTSTAGSQFEPRVYRLTGVSAGTHTIVGTLNTRVGADYLDSWGWGTPDPGLIAVVNIPRAPAYPFIDRTVTDSDVNTINPLIATMVASFDSNVALIDMDAVFQTAGTALANLFWTDNIHPNDAGHTLMTGAIYNTLVSRWPSVSTLSQAQAPGIDAQQALRIMEQPSTTGAKDSRMSTATLVAGTVTVTNRIVTATSRIFLSRATTGGTPGHLSYTISAGTSFTITSSSATDTSVINWMVVEPG